MPQTSRNTKKPTKPHPFYVVGLGASAGGMTPLLSFFKKMPADSGLAFIIVQHLSPDFKSFIGELLKNVTTMPIHTVTEGMSIQPNKIYLIPPNHNMTLNDHHFCLTTQKNHPRINYPIDLLFESLALNYKKKAIAVVLSGTGADGSLGIKKIAASGGLVLVESPDEAQFSGMPDSAIASDTVDHVCPVHQLPDLIIQYTSNPKVIKPNLHEHALHYTPEHKALFNLLFNQYKLDLHQYKIRTVFRRINRRIQAQNLHTIQEYLTHVTNHPEELALLYKDLLIGVTLFFRDSEAFDVLEKDVIPALFEHQKQTNQDIRVWCAACSTGEEAYSIAILLFEYAEKNKIPLKVKLFATDISTDFLNIASRGIYSEQAIHAITKTRLERYFFMEEAHYKISPMIRDMVIFVPHNLMSSPPFIKMDFITCRNFLIYVQPDMQKRILSFLHLGLNSSGFLFLGPNENISELAPFVEPITTTWKIYKKTRPLPTHFLFGHDAAHILSSPIPSMPSSTRTGTQPMIQYKTPKASGASLPKKCPS